MISKYEIRRIKRHLSKKEERKKKRRGDGVGVWGERGESNSRPSATKLLSERDPQVSVTFSYIVLHTLSFTHT